MSAGEEAEIRSRKAFTVADCKTIYTLKTRSDLLQLGDDAMAADDCANTHEGRKRLKGDLTEKEKEISALAQSQNITPATTATIVIEDDTEPA